VGLGRFPVRSGREPLSELVYRSSCPTGSPDIDGTSDTELGSSIRQAPVGLDGDSINPLGVR